MSMRVATFATTNSLLTSALRVQAQEAAITLQQSSGLKSTDYGGLGSASGKLVSLQSSITRSKAYAQTATTANERVEQTYDAVGSMIDLLTNFKSSVISISVSTTGSTDTTLSSNAGDTLDQLVSLMNTKYSGRYLMSGGSVGTAPVDVSGLATQTVPSTADTSYYQGDDTVASARVSSDQTIDYGVTADDPAFEKAIRALSLIAADNTDQDTRDEAADLIDDAVSGLTTIQSGLSLKSSALKDQISDQEDYQTFAASIASDVGDVDVAQAASQMSTYQAQLEAAYAAIGKIQSLSLSDYLK